MIYNSAYTIDQLKQYCGGDKKNSDSLNLLTNVEPTAIHTDDSYSCDSNGVFHFNLVTAKGQYYFVGNDIELNQYDYIEFECDVLNKDATPIKFWLSPRSLGSVNYADYIITSKTTKQNEWERITIRLLCHVKTLYRVSFGYDTGEYGEFYIKNIVRKVKTFNSDYYKYNLSSDHNDVYTNKVESDADTQLVLYGHKKTELWTDTYAVVLDESDGSFRPSTNTASIGLDLGHVVSRWNNIYCNVAPNVSSNREIKKDIELYDDNIAYENIQNMNIYSYKMKDEATYGNEVYYGSMLDELPEECLHVENEGVDLYGYTSYAISALKVAISKIKELEEEVKQLKSQNK